MPRPQKLGFTIVELLVVIAIIGVLVALLLPAVQMARESARSVKCRNNLKQLALSVELFYDTNGCYPPARLEPRPGDTDAPGLECGGEEATWMVRILPFIEQNPLYERWDVYSKWYENPANARIAQIPSFLCPSRRNLSQSIGERTVGGNAGRTLPCGCPLPPGDGSGFPVQGTLSDYAGNHGDLSPGSAGLPTDFYYGGNGTGIIISSRAKCVNGMPIDWADRLQHRHVSDGLSNTWLIGEKHVPQLEIAKFPFDSPAWDGDHLSASARVAGLGMRLGRGPNDTTASYFSFGSWHPVITHFARADGSVHSFRSSTDPFVLSQLAHRNDEITQRIQ